MKSAVHSRGVSLRWHRGVRMRVTGTSMMPSLRPGDVICVRYQEAAGSGLGDIVLFRRHGQLLARRVVRKIHNRGEAYWITRGDNLPENDPPVSHEELVGRVTAVQRGTSRITARKGLRKLGRVF